MSKLKDLVGKGVRLIVTDAESPLPGQAPASERDLGPDAFAGSGTGSERASHYLTSKRILGY